MTQTPGTQLIPSFPKGASLESILLACHWLLQAKSLERSESKIFGDTSHRMSVLAQGANLFAERALGGTISGRELAMHNSAWPVYSSLMQQPMADACLTDLISSSNLVAWHELIKPHKATGYAQDWRACPECCREDMGEKGCGLGHWRVIHQLPGVTYCPKHLTPLQYRCSGCKSPLGGPGKVAMPAWSCLNCGCNDKDELQVNETTGSKELVKIYAKLLSNEDIPLSPAHRVRLYQKILGENPSKDKINKYLNHFLTAFGFSKLAEMGRFLNINVAVRDVYYEIRKGKFCPPTLSLALASFAISNTKVVESVFNEYEHRISSWPMAAGGGISLLKFLEICRLAGNGKIPVTAIFVWTGGKSKILACDQILLSPGELSDFFENLTVYSRVFLKLDENVKKTGYLDLKIHSKYEIKKYHREKVKSAISSGVESRTDMNSTTQSSYLWCRVNDKKWLDINVPRRVGKIRNNHESAKLNCDNEKLSLLDAAVVQVR